MTSVFKNKVKCGRNIKQIARPSIWPLLVAVQLPILVVSVLPQEATAIGGSRSGGQLGVIVKWDLKKKKRRETKGSFHFNLPAKMLLIYEKQMCGWFEMEMKEQIWCT